MKFVKADPCPDHMLDPRWISETGIWEIGVHPVMFGKRVRVGKVKSSWCSLDYCAGADPEFLKELIVAVMVIMESFDETIMEGEVERIFPSFEIKPINRDPLCWAKIRRLAIEANLTKSISKPNLIQT